MCFATGQLSPNLSTLLDIVTHRKDSYQVPAPYQVLGTPMNRLVLGALSTLVTQIEKGSKGLGLTMLDPSCQSSQPCASDSTSGDPLPSRQL